MSFNLASMFGNLPGMLQTFVDAAGMALGDIVCVALFTLVDVILPYVTPMLSNSGVLNGIGGQMFSNFVQIFKLTLFTGYCKNLKFH